MFDHNGFLNRFPGTNFHELNIDWLVEAVKDIAKELQHFELVNQISYQGIWNITKQYPAWSIVTTNNDGYISLQPVPVGVNITNSQYWTKISNFSQELADLGNRMIAAEADIDALQTSDAKNRTWANYLYGKKIIVLGDSLTIGSGEALGHTCWENIATDYGCTVMNYGVSSSAIAGTGSQISMVNRIDNILFNNPTCDIFILMGGANDKNNNIPIGHRYTTDPDYFTGAINTIIGKVRNQYGTSCQILCMTTYHRYETVNNYGDELLYVNAMKEVCNYHSIPCFDNYANSIALAQDVPYSHLFDIGYTTGGVRSYHFNKVAYRYLTNIYAKWLCETGSNANMVLPAHCKCTFTGHTVVSDNSYRIGELVMVNARISLGTSIAQFGTIGQIPFTPEPSAVSDIAVIINNISTGELIAGYINGFDIKTEQAIDNQAALIIHTMYVCR